MKTMAWIKGHKASGEGNVGRWETGGVLVELRGLTGERRHK